MSEDGYLHVLQNTKNSLQVCRSLLFEHTTLIGTKFVAIDENDVSKVPPKPEHCIVMVTAYDRNRIAFV